MSRRVAWLLAAGLVLALAVGLLAWRAARPGSELERALSSIEGARRAPSVEETVAEVFGVE